MNVLMVLSDQHNARCMGVAGHPLAKTPHMDALAHRGVRFTNAYTQNTICTPSRISLLSGQYAHNHGYYGLNGQTPANLPEFMGHFRRHGYRTGYVGNVHLPNHPRAWLSDSLDVMRACYDGAGPGIRSEYFAYLEKLGLRHLEDSTRLPEFPGAMQHDGRPSSLPLEHSVEAWCAREAIEFMENSDRLARPFMLQVALPRPHQCYTPAREFWDMYPDDLPLPEFLLDPAASAHRPPHFRKEVEDLRGMRFYFEPKTYTEGFRRIWHGYLGLISQTDHVLGMMIDYLRQSGRDQDTIVFYGTDHGAYTGMYGLIEKAPGICSEAVCRIPYIWHVPGVTPAGRVCEQLAQSIDLGPTFASLCGVPEMNWVDGRDITSLLRGSDTPMHDLVATENAWSKAIRVGPWRFVHYVDGTFAGDQDAGELYNLADDPLELRNLYDDPAHKDRVHEMRRLLLDWLIRTTRVSTFWPVMNKPSGDIGRYPLGEDGKESVEANPARRAIPGAVKYL